MMWRRYSSGWGIGSKINSILGFILKHLGRYEQAQHQAEEGLALARQVGWRQEEGLTLEVLGEIALAKGVYDEALDYLLESAGILQSTGQLEQYEVLAVLGYVYLGLDEIPKAIKYLADALQSAAEIPTLFPIITALPGIALLLAEQGEVEKAVELNALASRKPRVANSHWFDDIAGRHIATSPKPYHLIESLKLKLGVRHGIWMSLLQNCWMSLVVCNIPHHL